MRPAKQSSKFETDTPIPILGRSSNLWRVGRKMTVARSRSRDSQGDAHGGALAFPVAPGTPCSVPADGISPPVSLQWSGAGGRSKFLALSGDSSDEEVESLIGDQPVVSS